MTMGNPNEEGEVVLDNKESQGKDDEKQGGEEVGEMPAAIEPEEDQS